MLDLLAKFAAPLTVRCYNIPSSQVRIEVEQTSGLRLEIEPRYHKEMSLLGCNVNPASMPRIGVHRLTIAFILIAF